MKLPPAHIYMLSVFKGLTAYIVNVVTCIVVIHHIPCAYINSIYIYCTCTLYIVSISSNLQCLHTY